MEDRNIEWSKLQFKTYLEVYLAYNNSQCPTELYLSYLVGRPMLMAFVCELGLKTLILLNGKEYTKIHYLNDLFDLISLENQKEIIQCLEMEESAFRDILSKNKKMFVEWRYFTEQKPTPADTKFIENFIIVIAILLLGETYLEKVSSYLNK